MNYYTYIYIGWMAEESGFDSRQGQDFSLLHIIQTGFGAHPTSYTMGIGSCFSGSKEARA
jgi:hypothetical protein